MKRFMAALAFLTALPVPESLRGETKYMAGCAIHFPAVGLLIGVLLIGINYGAIHLFAPLPAAVITAIAMSWVSGGLHMDGLADTADGFLSGAARERIFEIMKDSRTGAMGVFAVASVVALKSASIASLKPDVTCAALILTPFAGRIAMLAAISIYPYVSGANGLGNVFAPGVNTRGSVLWWAIMAAAGAVMAGITGIAWVIGVTFTFFAFGAYCRRKIGGMTGDTYGALCEMTETVSLLLLTAAI
ncbi:MAG: adenosylcobinamide-GDP ribazoletransferase [Nitrospinae bacterium]|nr:adenosylcobinamide-GDP ribazoletransferase [Nitrospinota bacterium]